MLRFTYNNAVHVLLQLVILNWFGCTLFFKCIMFVHRTLCARVATFWAAEFYVVLTSFVKIAVQSIWQNTDYILPNRLNSNFDKSC